MFLPVLQVCMLAEPINGATYNAGRVQSSGGGVGAGRGRGRGGGGGPQTLQLPPKILACYKHWSDNNLGFNTFQMWMLGVKVCITWGIHVQVVHPRPHPPWLYFSPKIYFLDRTLAGNSSTSCLTSTDLFHDPINFFTTNPLRTSWHKITTAACTHTSVELKSLFRCTTSVILAVHTMENLWVSVSYHHVNYLLKFLKKH